MDFKVELDPNEVNKALIETILKTSIGSIIVNSVEGQVKKLTEGGYNNPIDQCVKEMIGEVVKDLISQRKEEIRQIINTRLSNSHVEKAIDRFEAWLDKQYL